MFLIHLIIPPEERFVQSASCVFGHRLMVATSSFMKLTSLHAQERLELLNINTEDISITSINKGVLCRRNGCLYVSEYRAELRDFVHGLGMFGVDADAFARKSWIRFLCVSGFSRLRRVRCVFCPAGLITNKR